MVSIHILVKLSINNGKPEVADVMFASQSAGSMCTHFNREAYAELLEVQGKDYESAERNAIEKVAQFYPWALPYLYEREVRLREALEKLNFKRLDK